MDTRGRRGEQEMGADVEACYYKYAGRSVI